MQRHFWSTYAGFVGKYVLSFCITSQSIIKSDSSSGCTQKKRVLHAPPLTQQRRHSDVPLKYYAVIVSTGIDDLISSDSRPQTFS